jgi:hypothetical protein
MAKRHPWKGCAVKGLGVRVPLPPPFCRHKFEGVTIMKKKVPMKCTKDDALSLNGIAMIKCGDFEIELFPDCLLTLEDICEIKKGLENAR